MNCKTFGQNFATVYSIYIGQVAAEEGGAGETAAGEQKTHRRVNL